MPLRKAQHRYDMHRIHKRAQEMETDLRYISEDEDIDTIGKNTPFFLREDTIFDSSIVIVVLLTPDFLFKYQWYPNELVDLVAKEIVICVLGALSIILIQSYQKWKFRSPYQNGALRELLDRAAKHVGVTRSFEVWSYDTDKPCLLGLTTLRFSAVVVSETAAQDIIAHGRDGEAVMADILARMKHGGRTNTWAPFSIIAMPSLFMLWLMVSEPNLKVALAIFGIFVLIAMDIMPPVAAGRQPWKTVLETYGVHPTAARILVFRGREPNAEERLKIHEQMDKSMRPLFTPVQTALIDLISVLVALLLTALSHQRILEAMPFVADFLGSTPLSVLLIFGIFLVVSRIAIGHVFRRLNHTDKKAEAMGALTEQPSTSTFK